MRGDGRDRAIGAGVTAAIFFAVAPLPLQVAVAADMGLAPPEASRWILVTWASGAIASIVLSLRARQPIAITWSVLGLVYLGAAAGDHAPAEIVGANLVAGLAILALALLGVGERVMGLVPLPIVVAMFAGSILEYVTGAVAATADDTLVAGAAVAAFLAARATGVRRLPPVGVAAIAGALVAVAAGRVGPLEGAWEAPAAGLPAVALSPGAILALSPPLVVFALALGNVQGLGYLQAQGYRPPVDAVSVAVGAASVVNALAGGHQAAVGRATTAIVAGPDAGPAATRHVASVVAATGALAIAAGASLVVAVVGALPPALVAVVTGLAVLPVLQDALERSLTGPLRTASLTAFLVAATPFDALGLGAATWALVAGLGVALATEREGLAAATAAARRRRGPTPLGRALRRVRATGAA